MKHSSVVQKIFVGLTLSLAPVEAQRGYQLSGDEVVVDLAQHWRQWTIPAHLAHIDEAGSVRTRQLRTVYNVLEDRTLRRPIIINTDDPRIGTIDSTMQFDVFGEPIRNTLNELVFDYWVRPGISRVGSNPQLADRILDGDPTTFWEPDPRDPIEQWWIEVDLGRAVPVERLKLQFVDEELGDPFLQFIMLLSRRQSALLHEPNSRIGFQLFIPQDAPSTTQREYIFESEHTSPELPLASGVVSDRLLIEARKPSPEWTGKSIETIRIVVTDTRGGRAEQITQEAWEGLSVEERGDVVYFARDVAGREEPVDEATYQALAAERQGRQDYYRRELPRLAEVEAWGWGDNIGINLVKNGGSLALTTPGKNPLTAFDGDDATSYSHQTRNPLNPGGNVLTVDIGGAVWLEQVRLTGSGMRGYIMRASAGGRDVRGGLKWQRISPAEREYSVAEALPRGDSGRFSSIVDPQDPPLKVRLLDMIVFAHFPPGFVGGRSESGAGQGILVNAFWSTISEIMLFSSRPPAEVVLESDLIELPGLVALGAVHWDADTPLGTDVEIRTRTGDQLLQQIRYFDKTGNSKTADEYRTLAGFLKGPSDTTVVVGPGWSAWSQQYRQSGELASSPSLRRFMQVQVRLKNDGGQHVPELHRLSVGLQQPVVQGLRAEVWPTAVEAGVLDTFALFVQPDFLAQPANMRSLGFDEVRVRAEPGLDLRLVDVALGTEAELASKTPFQRFTRGGDGRLVDAQGAELAVHAEGDSLWLRFPETVQGTPSEILAPVYYRAVAPGDEVPSGLDRNLLTFTSYSLLPEAEQGAVRYFRQQESGSLVEVDAETYEALAAAEQGPVRYFRKVVGLGDQVPFDAAGDSLDQSRYNRLGDQRGWVVDRGRLVRLRFASRVYLQGTRLAVAVRQSEPPTAWQAADGGDVTGLSPAKSLAIRAQGADAAIAQVAIAPNPFTPNGDGVNEVVEIDFSLFRVQAERSLAVRIYTLAGRQVRQLEALATGGQQRFIWDGRDEDGRVVAPGLYLCKIEVDADATAFARQTRVHLIAVAY